MFTYILLAKCKGLSRQRGGFKGTAYEVPFFVQFFSRMDGSNLILLFFLCNFNKLGSMCGTTSPTHRPLGIGTCFFVSIGIL